MLLKLAMLPREDLGTVGKEFFKNPLDFLLCPLYNKHKIRNKFLLI